LFYIVATPIGSLDEITLRAISVLKQVDAIYCEDTRRSKILMGEYDIDTPLIRLDKFCERQKTQEIISKLKDGRDIALISDAGMPLICDPGSLLLGSIIQNGLQYTVVSGASALVNGLVLSGLDISRFFMVGFLPQKNKDRDQLLLEICNLSASLVFYVPPHDCIDILNYLYQKLGSREVAVVREISKVYEQVIRFKLGEIPQFVQKGEIVIVVEGKKNTEVKTESQILSQVQSLIKMGYDKRDAVKEVSQECNIKKSTVYNLLEKTLQQSKD